jgi:antitoxin (DNA-binding transcriptional repressor) of toxin-antitoxin stability system
MRALDEGDTFIVTRNGIPVGRLTPIARRTFIPTTELKEAFAHLPQIDYAELRAELDAVIDQDPTPRV